MLCAGQTLEKRKKRSPTESSKTINVKLIKILVQFPISDAISQTGLRIISTMFLVFVFTVFASDGMPAKIATGSNKIRPF